MTTHRHSLSGKYTSSTDVPIPDMTLYAKSVVLTAEAKARADADAALAVRIAKLEAAIPVPTPPLPPASGLPPGVAARSTFRTA